MANIKEERQHALYKEIYEEYTWKNRPIKHSTIKIGEKTIADVDHVHKEIIVYTKKYTEAVQALWGQYEDYTVPELIDPVGLKI